MGHAMNHPMPGRCVAFAILLHAASAAHGQVFPTRPLRMLTAEPGGGSDLVARIIAQGLSASLGQQVVVDNRVGGVIIAELTAKAPADGYTLLTYSNTLWLIPLMRTHTAYDPLRDC
jgi:tripartite-type tricarboxylate transporter receptor subunit TctC